MRDSLEARSRELSAISREFDRTTRRIAGIDPARLDPARLAKYHQAQSVLRNLRTRIAEARRRLAESRRRRSSCRPLMLRRDKQRLAARVRRQTRRKAAASAKKATADPDPHRKRKNPPGGWPAGPKPRLGITDDGSKNTRRCAAVNRSAPWRR
jgi:hypothetical protein